MLESYEKMSFEVLQFLKQDPTIFLINSLLFRTVIVLARENRIASFNSLSFDHINIFSILPQLNQQIENDPPQQLSGSAFTYHFGIELIGQFGVSWIPVCSPIYINTMNTNYCNDLEMLHWQRMLRTQISQSKEELLLLTLDNDSDVRQSAIKKIKTFYS
jgi:hypothetical protein